MPDHRVILTVIGWSAEIALLFYLLVRVVRRRADELMGVAAYIAVSLAVGAVRLYAAVHYGVMSFEYGLWYWFTDYALILALFLLISSFFRRACVNQPRVWQRVRVALMSALVMTGAISYSIIAYRGHSFFPYFVIEFQQDLYFACMVLTTALYFVMVKFDDENNQLGLLLSGLGMMFAGSAASYALFIVAGKGPLYGLLTEYIPQLSDIAMVSIWFYAASLAPRHVYARAEEWRAREALPSRVLARTS